jgi:hypothetical protein
LPSAYIAVQEEIQSAQKVLKVTFSASSSTVPDSITFKLRDPLNETMINIWTDIDPNTTTTIGVNDPVTITFN